jgi:tRNA-modifying protein YgfZ
VTTRLAKFVLRAKVTIEEASTRWSVHGSFGIAPPEWPQERDAQLASGGVLVACLGSDPGRWLQLAPAEPAAPAAPHTTRAPEVAGAPAAWTMREIAAGEPQVFGTTSESFVAQMLNLDIVGAVAFDKGCYTGQEIIARTHYRGRAKRRMQRFRASSPLALPGGTRGRLADGRAFIVVQSARDNAATEFLAVAPVALRAGDEAESAADAAGAPALEAAQLPLPYSF